MKHRPGLLRTTALLAMAALAAGCGSANGSANGSAAGGGSSVTDAGYRVLALVSAARGGGVPTTALTWLRDDEDASQFAAQFSLF